MPDPKPFQKLKPKIKGMRKPSIKTCAFLKPSKMTKEGRTILTKRCIAYIPNFEVPEEREICELCGVPEMYVRDDRCSFIAPLDLEKTQETRWKCSKTSKKFIDPDQCNASDCADYEKGQKSRWDIGMLGRYRGNEPGT